MNTTVTVYGASGHTGRFVMAELQRRGLTAIPAGRPVAPVDDPAALDRALAGADAVINAAGPFATTAGPLIEAAIRAGIAYVDVAAEIEANVDTFARYARAPIPIVPAMAFYGGLADLLATAAMGDWAEADAAHVAYLLDGWHPTPGTRAAGAVSRERRAGRRVRYSGGRLEYRDDAPPRERWGDREVIAEFSMADIVTIPSHLRIPEVRSYMTVEAAGDLADPHTPPPVPGEQTFAVEVVVARGAERRRAVARGRDIYAVSAPLAVEAVERVLADPFQGARSAGAAFDAAGFLAGLGPEVGLDIALEAGLQVGLEAGLQAGPKAGLEIGLA